MKKKTTKKSKVPSRTKPNLIGKPKLMERLEFIKFVALPRVFREREWGFNTDKDFAKKFKVNESTLVEWKKDGTFADSVMETIKMWGKDKTPDVLAGLYKKAAKDGNAAEVKLWIQYFEDWKEKSEVNVHYAAIKEIQDFNRKLFDEEAKKE